MKPANPEELKVILQQVGLTNIDVGKSEPDDASPRMFGSGRVRMPATPKNAAASLRQRLNALGANFRINIRLAQVFVIVWLGDSPKLPVDTVVENLLSKPHNLIEDDHQNWEFDGASGKLSHPGGFLTSWFYWDDANNKWSVQDLAEDPPKEVIDWVMSLDGTRQTSTFAPRPRRQPRKAYDIPAHLEVRDGVPKEIRDQMNARYKGGRLI